MRELADITADSAAIQPQLDSRKGAEERTLGGWSGAADRVLGQGAFTRLADKVAL